MKRCKCCRQIGSRGDYAIRSLELHCVIPYVCPLDGYTYVSEEMLPCAETEGSAMDLEERSSITIEERAILQCAGCSLLETEKDLRPHDLSCTLPYGGWEEWKSIGKTFTIDGRDVSESEYRDVLTRMGRAP